MNARRTVEGQDVPSLSRTPFKMKAATPISTMFSSTKKSPETTREDVPSTAKSPRLLKFPLTITALPFCIDLE
jgi:hypothetical protein